MDMVVGHVDADHGNTDPLAGDGLLDAAGNLLGEHHHLAEQVVGQVKDVIVLEFSDDQRMAFGNRGDIQESEEMLIFRDFVTGDFPFDDLSENSLFHL